MPQQETITTYVVKAINYTYAQSNTGEDISGWGKFCDCYHWEDKTAAQKAAYRCNKTYLNMTGVNIAGKVIEVHSNLET